MNLHLSDRRFSWRLLLCLLCGLAFGLRIYQLDNSGFWQDEGLTPLRSSYAPVEILSGRIIIQEGVTQDTHPPLYYLLIHFSRQLWGESDFAYRFFSVLWGALLIPVAAQFGRRLHGRRLGLLAALLAAVNPLQIWYAQEARMYTLLVFLAALMSYLLWRTMSRPGLSERQVWGSAGLYGLVAALTIYTHYAALFLVVGQGALWLALLWRRGYRQLIGLALLALAAIALPLILPIWPRLFTGAEANYFYVPPWIMLQDVVHGFGLGMTVDFSQWSIKLIDLATAVLLVAGLIFLGQSQRRAAFLLVYLLAAVAGLALGSLIKPMYMGARHIMVGSPAFFFLAAAGLLFVWQRWGRAAGTAALFLLLLGPMLSLHNLYHDPSYAKDDLRALARYVESQAGNDDLVLYNNAILLALHSHYSQRPDLPVTALPVYPYGADERTIMQLAELAGQYRRIWYVPDPPADGRDDDAAVSGWLDSRAFSLNRQQFHGQTMSVEAQLYQTDEPLLLASPFAPPTAAGEAVQLLGWEAHFDNPAVGPQLWFSLFWDGRRPPLPDQELRFNLLTPDGSLWASRASPLRPAGGEVLRWPMGGVVNFTYSLPIPPGTPPGPYQLFVELVGLSEPSFLDEVTIEPAHLWPFTPPPPLNQVGPLHFDNGLSLQGLFLADLTVRPGHPLPMTLFWRRGADVALPADIVYQLDLIGVDGRAQRSQRAKPGPAWLSPQDWPMGADVAEMTAIYFPPEMPPGRYRMRWQLLLDDEVTPGRPGWRPWSSRSLWLGSVTVLAWPLNRELPAMMTPVGVEFGGIIELAGYQTTGDAPRPGDALALDLVWRALAPPSEDYFVFIHMMDAAGEIVSQVDWIPVEGVRPTPGWRMEEVLIDSHRLPLPIDLPAGEYQLWVGLYEPESGQRLPVAGREDGRRLLFTITLP